MSGLSWSLSEWKLEIVQDGTSIPRMRNEATLHRYSRIEIVVLTSEPMVLKNFFIVRQADYSYNLSASTDSAQL